MNTIRFGSSACLLMLGSLCNVGHAQELASMAKTEVEPTAFVASLKSRQLGVGDVIPGVSLFRIRAGIMTLPQGGFVGGVDFEVPSLHLFGLTTRIDGEAIFFNKTSFPITINEIYSKGLFHGLKIYVGAGAGIFMGEQSRFGAKAFGGIDLTSKFGIEGDVYFAGSGVSQVGFMVRLSL